MKGMIFSTKNKYGLVAWVVVVLIVVILLNPDKTANLNFKSLIHIAFQSIFLIGIYAYLDKHIKFIFTFYIVVSLGAVLTYKSFPSVGMIMSIFNSSQDEVYDFVRFNLKELLITTLLFFGLLALPTIKHKGMNRSFVILGLLYLVIPAILFATSSKEIPFNFIQSGLARGMTKSGTQFEYIYSEELAHRFPPLRTLKGITDTINFIKTSSESTLSTWSNVKLEKNPPRLLIIGLGESLRADHLGIYGYKRDTTPLLQALKDSGNIYFYKNVYSGGTNTWTSVPSMFTQFDLRPKLSKSIINLANDAGYQTYWLSNQTKVNKWDFSVSAIALQSKYSFFTANEDTNNIQYDGILIPKLLNILKNRKTDEKTLIVLHFYGSHMDFKDRYPPSFSKYDRATSVLGENTDQYDNSVLYTDFTLAKIFEISKKYRARFIYFSDHGLGRTDGDIPLKHDVRETPDADSMNVPLISNYELKLNQNYPINLFYFECIFSEWSGITAEELKMNYCNKMQNNIEIIFYDTHLRLVKILSNTYTRTK